MMTDPIADMLTRIRNAQMSKKHFVEIPFSKLKFAIANILLKESYINKVEKKDGNPAILNVELKYIDKKPAITSLKRESKPGHRMYRKVEELPHILNGYGMAIVSTSRGLMTVKAAKKEGLGGEVVCSCY